MDTYIDLPASFGVTSLDGLTGDINLVAGTNITITNSSPNITISATTGPSSITIDVSALSYFFVNSATSATGNNFAFSWTPIGSGSFLAGPVSGVNYPTFRGINVLDLPFITVPYAGTGKTSFTAYSVICGGTTSTGNLQNVSGVGTSGYVLTSNGAGALPSWQAGGGGGSGTVTSVALSDGSSTPIYTISGSPVTSSGTLTFTLNTESANKVFAGPTSGSAGQPTFRSLVGADLPNPSATTLGGIESYAAVSHQWINAISTSGVPSSTQPAFSDISGTVNLSSQASGTLQAAQFPALTGDATTSSGSLATSLVATSNSTLTTLSALTTASSLATVGTITSGTWNGTTIAIAHGGTGQTSQTAAFDALSPLTTAGDLIYYNGTHNVRLGIGSSNQILTVSAGEPAWAAAPATGVTSVALSDGSTTPIYTITGSPVTTSGTLTFTLNTESANLVFAGPSSGSAAQPTFRSLVAADIPSLSYVTSVAMTVPSFLSVSGSPITSSGTLAVSYSGTALPIANGGTAVTSVTTAPTATAFAGWDANSNLSANNFIPSYRSTATAGTTTTLTVGSEYEQYFTGTTTQTVKLPVTSTLVTGMQFLIVNNSTGIVTVESSGGNTLQAMAANTQLIATVLSTSGTGTASWSWIYSYQSGTLGTVTSVGLVDSTGLFTVTGSPVTSSGNLTLSAFASQTANTFLAAPNGSSGAPTFRTIAGADLPNPSSSTLGGIQSIAAVSHEWINSISTSGVPSLTQPAFTDISGSLAGSQLPTFTGDVTNSGAAMTVAKIQGTTVSGTTGTTNVVFSASPTVTGTLTAATVAASAAVTGGVSALSFGTTVAVNAALGNTFTLTMTGNCTISAPSNPTSGQRIVFIVLSSGGSYTATFSTATGGFSFGSTIQAVSATATGTYDYIGAIYNAGDSKWNIVAYVQGY